MDKAIFDRLEAYCERAGQSKTVDIERALNRRIDEQDDRAEVPRAGRQVEIDEEGDG